MGSLAKSILLRWIVAIAALTAWAGAAWAQSGPIEGRAYERELFSPEVIQEALWQTPELAEALVPTPLIAPEPTVTVPVAAQAVPTLATPPKKMFSVPEFLNILKVNNVEFIPVRKFAPNEIPQVTGDALDFTTKTWLEKNIGPIRIRKSAGTESPFYESDLFKQHIYAAFSSIQRKNAAIEQAGGSSVFQTIKVIYGRASLRQNLVELGTGGNVDEIAAAFDKGAAVRRVVIASPVKLVRFFGDGAKLQGRWFLCCADPHVNADGTALPPNNSANFLAHVQIPKGTEILVGVVAPNFQKVGGATQFFIPKGIRLSDSDYTLFEKCYPREAAAHKRITVYFGAEKSAQADKVVSFVPVAPPTPPQVFMVPKHFHYQFTKAQLQELTK